MKALSQPAYLRLPFRLAFSEVSARARLSAIRRSKARFRAAFRSRTRLASSRKPTSSTQCSPFSIDPPVVPDGGRQPFRGKRRAGEVGPEDLGRDLAGAVDPADDGLDRQQDRKSTR